MNLKISENIRKTFYFSELIKPQNHQIPHVTYHLLPLYTEWSAEALGYRSTVEELPERAPRLAASTYRGF